MAECFICGRSGRGLGINRGQFFQSFCSMTCQDAAYAVLNRGGVPQMGTEQHAKALEVAIKAFDTITQQNGADIAKYTPEQARNLVDGILHYWQNACFNYFCQSNQVTVPPDYAPKPNNDTDNQYAAEAMVDVGAYLDTVFGTDTSQWTLPIKQGFVFAVVDSVRRNAESECPF